MFYDITLWIIISLILITIIHHLFLFFKDTLTVPKVKDLVIQPSENYKDIENIISKSTTNINDLQINNFKKDISPIDQNDMKNELKNFFNELKDNSTSNNENNPFTKIYQNVS